MKNHNGDIRGFYHLSESWYAEASLKNTTYIDEVMLGFYPVNGRGTSGEFAIRWMILNNRKVPYIECFDDSWHTLNEFKDVIEKLAEIDGLNATPKKICHLLLSLGFKDMTPRETPYK